MSDSESVSSAASNAAPSISELIKQAREHQKAAAAILKEVEGAAKGMKVSKKKAASGEKKPRKTSDGQRKWQAFQKFVWDELKAENPAIPFKAAMQAAGPRWAAGNPISEEDQAAFEAWLEENPIPSAEEAADAREAKDAAAAEEKLRKKAEREAEKAEKAATAKAAKAEKVKAAKAAAPAKASPAAAAAKAVAKVAPKPAAPVKTAAPVKANKGLADGDHTVEGVACTVVSNHVFKADDCSAIGVISPLTGKLDKSAKAIAACNALMAEPAAE